MSRLQALRASVLLMEMLLLAAGSFSKSARAASPAFALEPTSSDAAQGARPNASPEKARAGKGGHVRIATLGPRPR